MVLREDTSLSSRKAAQRFIDWSKRVDATGDIGMNAQWCFCLLELGTRMKTREGGESGDKRLTLATRRVSYLLINRQLYACVCLYEDRNKKKRTEE